jgi:hypothetical protein
LLTRAGQSRGQKQLEGASAIPGEALMNRIRFVSGLAAFTLITLTGTPAPAFFHLWRFTEFFSNADGTVQFIELQSSGPGETQANGAVFSSARDTKFVLLFVTNFRLM